MNDLERQISDFVEKDFEALVSLRREFHRHPEVGQQEFRTAARIEEELDKLGLPHYRCAGTGVVAFVDGTAEGPAVPDGAGRPRCMALRADIDALPLEEQRDSVYRSENPGRMHACGHDVPSGTVLRDASSCFSSRMKNTDTGRCRW